VTNRSTLLSRNSLLITALVFGLVSGCALLPPAKTDLSTTSQKILSSPSSNAVPIGRSSFKKKTAASQIKSVILLIGDGMGFEHINAASLYAHGAEGQLFMQTAPYQHVMSTANVEDAVTDSAAAATAMATGQQVENRVLSMDSTGEPLETSLEFFQRRCKSTGLVASSYLNHATPAAFAAHRQDREMLKQIAADIYQQTKPNVLLGGTAEGITSAMATQSGYTVVKNRAELLDVPNSVPYLSGQFSNGNMGYEYEHALDIKPYYSLQPHLSEMATKAVEILDHDPDGFFLMIEGSRIDHASHTNSLPHVIFEVLEFDKTVQRVVEWAAGRSDVMVIATADHETGGMYELEGGEKGVFPTVSWATGQHTSSQVPIFGWNVNHPEQNSNVSSTFVYRLTTNGFEAPSTECVDELKASQNTAGASLDVRSDLQADSGVGTHNLHLPIILSAEN